MKHFSRLTPVTAAQLIGELRRLDPGTEILYEAHGRLEDLGPRPFNLSLVWVRTETLTTLVEGETVDEYRRLGVGDPEKEKDGKWRDFTRTDGQRGELHRSYADWRKALLLS